MEIRKSRHSAHCLCSHVIFITKYRKKVFSKIHLEYLENLFKESMGLMNGELIEFDGEADHVHLLIQYQPEWSISKTVNNLKGRASRLLRRDYPETKFSDSLWSRTYYVASVGGAPIEILKEYIQNQNTPD